MIERKNRQHVELVPLSERVWAMMAFRTVAACVLIGLWIGVPVSHVHSASWHIATGAGYLATTLAISSLVRLRSRTLAIGSFGAALLLDSIYFSVNTYFAGGVWNYASYLIAAHLVAVALLGSFRTGIKIAAWYSLLTIGLVRAQQTDLIPLLDPQVRSGSIERVLISALVVLWFVALATSTLAAINERELRRRRYDADALFKFSQSLHSTVTPAAVAERLTAFVVDELDGGRVAVLELIGGTPTVLGGRSLHQPKVAAAESALLNQVVAGGPRLIGRLLAEHDPWLHALMPGATRVVMVPLLIPGELHGVLVFEHSGRRGSRIERRIVTAAEKGATDAALAISRSALLERVQAAALTDGLTSLANRRSFDDALSRALAISGRQKRPVSLVMIDIDHFKACNDLHGHQTGDEVLRAVGAALASTSRSGDMPCRYGGEEFAVIMPGADATAAARAAERFRLAIAGADSVVPVTASLGVATFPEQGSDPQRLITSADAALYTAKANGRDQVVVSGRPVASPPTAPADVPPRNAQVPDAQVSNAHVH